MTARPLLSCALAAGLLTSIAACPKYEPPPTATLQGLTNGILKDPLDPIVVKFATPVDPSSVTVEIVPFTIDAYGNLPDEIPDGGALDVLASHSPTADVHVKATFSADHTTLTLVPTPVGWLPTGPSLVLLVDPGVVSTTTGTELHYRERLPFSYAATCSHAGPTKFESGAYFFLLNVSKPLGVELKVFAAIDVNAETGAFFGQFTAAVRNPDPNRCDPPCTDGTVCQRIPSQQCVEVSTLPASLEEYPDYVVKATSPNGYTFEMHGCASDVGDAGAVNILTSPGSLTVPSPSVSIDGLTFTGEFVPRQGGGVVASGSLTATKTFFLGTDNLGAGAGTLSAISIPDGSAPPGLPQPGTTADGGADAVVSD